MLTWWVTWCTTLDHWFFFHRHRKILNWTKRCPTEASKRFHHLNKWSTLCLNLSLWSDVVTQRIFSPARMALCAWNFWPATHREQSMNLEFSHRSPSSSASLQSGTFTMFIVFWPETFTESCTTLTWKHTHTVYMSVQRTWVKRHVFNFLSCIL